MLRLSTFDIHIDIYEYDFGGVILHHPILILPVQFSPLLHIFQQYNIPKTLATVLRHSIRPDPTHRGERKYMDNT